VDISLLYLRISRTMSKKALSTFMRDFADVSMNLQPNCRATASPSEREPHTGQYQFLTGGLKGSQITLIPHDNDGKVVFILHPQYLLLERHNLLERLPRRYRIY